MRSHSQSTSAMTHRQSQSGDSDSSGIPQYDDVDGSSLVQLQLHAESSSQPADSSTSSPRAELRNLKSRLLKDLEDAMAPSFGAVPFSAASDTCNFSDTFTLGCSKSHSANMFDYSSTQREILSGLKTSGHLGLSSHSETDWSAHVPLEKMEEVEDVEDMDVLSLYEYDTFLESEEELDQQSHGVALHKRFVKAV